MDHLDSLGHTYTPECDWRQYIQRSHHKLPDMDRGNVGECKPCCLRSRHCKRIRDGNQLHMDRQCTAVCTSILQSRFERCTVNFHHKAMDCMDRVGWQRYREFVSSRQMRRHDSLARNCNRLNARSHGIRRSDRTYSDMDFHSAHECRPCLVDNRCWAHIRGDNTVDRRCNFRCTSIPAYLALFDKLSSGHTVTANMDFLVDVQRRWLEAMRTTQTDCQFRLACSCKWDCDWWLRSVRSHRKRPDMDRCISNWRMLCWAGIPNEQCILVDKLVVFHDSRARMSTQRNQMATTGNGCSVHMAMDRTD